MTVRICSWCVTETGGAPLAALTADVTHTICRRHLRALYPSALDRWCRATGLRRWSLSVALGLCALAYLAGHVLVWGNQ